MSVRLTIFRIVTNLARALEICAEAVMRPEDLIRLNHRFYAQMVWNQDDHDVTRGLHDWEQQLIGSLATRGRALACGCGTGREVIGLARLGFQVMGVDIVETVVERARENARKAGMEADFEVQDITTLSLSKGPFDLVTLLGYPYSLIPTRRKRIEMLSRIRSVLTPNGRCLINFYTRQCTKRQQWVHRLRKLVAFVTFGNRECQVGDIIHQGAFFTHFFQDPKEIEEEARAAEFQIERLDFHHEQGGHALLTHAS